MEYSNFNIKKRLDILPVEVKDKAYNKKKKHKFGFNLTKKKKTDKKEQIQKANSTTLDIPMAMAQDDTKKRKLHGKSKRLEKMRLKNQAKEAQNRLFQEASRVKKLQNNSNDLDAYREQLRGLGKLVGDKELQKLLKMGTPIQNVNRRITMRFVLVLICLFVGGMVGLMLKKMGAGAVFGIMLGGIMYLVDVNTVATTYERFQLQRQMAFSQFVRLAASYLPEMNDGQNLFAIFKKILPRLEHKRDRTALERLMIDMQPNPEDPTPWNNFAKAFSVSDRAVLIMQTIQQMYLGDTSSSNIQALARAADDEVISQVDQIIAKKLHKFNNLTTKIMMTCMIPLLGFFTMFMLQQLRGMFDGLTNAQEMNTK